MKTCIYDNPATMAREYWQDGRMLAHYAAELWLQKDLKVRMVGPPWKPGQIVGDPKALDKPT